MHSSMSQVSASEVLILIAIAGLTCVAWFVWASGAQRMRAEPSPSTAVEVEQAVPPPPADGDAAGKASHSAHIHEPKSDAVDSATEVVGATAADFAQQPPSPQRQQTGSIAKRNDEYTVGWICALVVEHVAAQLLLDEVHQGPQSLATHDTNDYNLGRMGRHNIVIAVMPDGEYGLSSATGVAKDMLHSFPNVRIGLMVGIGGGAPSPRHDIRLGDVVVSAPRDNHGGVFQYDFGKAIGGQGFLATGFLNQPPVLLRTALSGLRSHHEIHGHQIKETVRKLARGGSKRLRLGFQRPDPSRDRLYRSEVAHPADAAAVDCRVSCGSNPANLVTRQPRELEDGEDPVIHYGLIASANTLMKDASIRDKLAREKGILCFEMEAAGLMNQFPCLVIRGICDYSDTHKNKEWQGYAAMVAAAYAKELLSRIPPRQIEAEARITDVLLGNIHKVAAEHLDIAKEQLMREKAHAENKLSDEEARCHQQFRLTNSTKDATYEWYKDRIPKRVEGTCEWFLGHPNFQHWLKRASGPLLVSADPGCGKSVLARYLIDHVLPGEGEATICYFFFKDQDQNTIQQALCAVLHQLFREKPALIKHAIERSREDGQGLIHSTKSLWKVLLDALKDPKAGQVIIVLDALDECTEQGFVDLIQNIEDQFPTGYSDYGQLKYLLTCRPYSQIVGKFHGLLKAFPNIHIPGEDASEAISHEVDCVVAHRVDRLSEVKGLKPAVRQSLEIALQQATHRTYLWVYLVFDYLENENFKKTSKGVEEAVATLPRGVNEAYDRILTKSKEDPIVRKVLSIVLAATRPLTLAEMNVAVNSDDKVRSLEDIDLEEEEDFKRRLRSWCGLFISVYHERIYFLHQTAKEFLMADSSSSAVPSGLRWHHCITSQQAHATLAKTCVVYLASFDSDTGETYLDPKEIDVRDFGKLGAVGHAIHKPLPLHALLNYAATFWGTHFHQAETVDEDGIAPFALKISDPGSRSYSAWFETCWWSPVMQGPGVDPPRNFTALMVASFFGHRASVEILLGGVAVDIEAKDSWYGRTPLSWAAANGHATIVRLLLEKGAETESKGAFSGSVPLTWAAGNGHADCIQELLDKGAEIDSTDVNNRTPLSWAAGKGQRTCVEVLLDRGAKAESKDLRGWTPLTWAAERGQRSTLRTLVGAGAELDVPDKYGRTPLSHAAKNGYEDIAGLLLDRGADPNSKDYSGWTPLFWAAAMGDVATATLLLDRGADMGTRDKTDMTALSWAESYSSKTLPLLRSKGAPGAGLNPKYLGSRGRA